MEPEAGLSFGFQSRLPAGCSGIWGNDGYGNCCMRYGYARTHRNDLYAIPIQMYGNVEQPVISVAHRYWDGGSQ